MKCKVNYSGFYYIEADSTEEALETDRDDADVAYEEWENDSAEEVDDFEITF